MLCLKKVLVTHSCSCSSQLTSSSPFSFTSSICQLAPGRCKFVGRGRAPGHPKNIFFGEDLAKNKIQRMITRQAALIFYLFDVIRRYSTFLDRAPSNKYFLVFFGQSKKSNKSNKSIQSPINWSFTLGNKSKML